MTSLASADTLATAKDMWRAYERAKEDGLPEAEIRDFLEEGLKAQPLAPVLRLGLAELASTKDACAAHAASCIELVKKMRVGRPGKGRARRLASALLRLSAECKRRKLFDLAVGACVEGVVLADPWLSDKEEQGNEEAKAALTLAFECRMAMGSALRKKGQKEEAAKAFEAAAGLVEKAGEMMKDELQLAKFWASACKASKKEDLVAAPPTAHLVSLYEHYAETFDEKLVGKLKYGTPAFLCAAINKLGRGPFASAADIGCGTGLSGVALRDNNILAAQGAQLVGVDLSPAMLEQAKTKGNVYDELCVGECVEAMETMSKEGKRFQLLVACDVLPYVGKLTAFFRHARDIVEEGGVLAFSTESLNTSEEEAIVLNVTGRYAHSPAYIKEEAARAGLTVASITAVEALRYNGGAAVPGHVSCLLRSEES